MVRFRIDAGFELCLEHSGLTELIRVILTRSGVWEAANDSREDFSLTLYYAWAVFRRAEG